MSRIDPIDIGLHVAVAVIATLAAGLLHPFFAVIVAAANCLFWPIRENAQTDRQNWNLRGWSLNKHLEAWMPGIAALGAAAVLVYL